MRRNTVDAEMLRWRESSGAISHSVRWAVQIRGTLWFQAQMVYLPDATAQSALSTHDGLYISTFEHVTSSKGPR